MEYQAVVEIPKGSHNKYELKPDGSLVLEWVSPVPFAENYGFFADTLCEDGDAVDVIIASTHPLLPKTKLMVRPLAVLYMIDDDEIDHKVVAVACADPALKNVVDVEDIEGLSKEFIEISLTDMKKAVGATAVFNGWGDAEQACRIIDEAMKLYAEQ